MQINLSEAESGVESTVDGNLSVLLLMIHGADKNRVLFDICDICYCIEEALAPVDAIVNR